MRSVRRTLAFLAVGMSWALVLMCAQPASAYVHWNNNYHYVYSPANGLEYFIGSAAITNGFEGPVNKAVSNWNSATSKVNFTRTTIQANSRLDWTNPHASNNACANTNFYVGSTNVQAPSGQPTQNYTWAKVQIRDALNSVASCGAASHRKGILAHEMGHALGLAHAPGNVIMRFDIAAYDNLNTPQQDDINGVNSLY